MGRAWVDGSLFPGEPSSTTRTDAELWGITLDPEILSDGSDDGVWSENIEAAMAFLMSTTQWRFVSGMGGGAVTGLDYTAVTAGLTNAGFEITPALWGDLRVIEAGALAAMREDGS